MDEREEERGRFAPTASGPAHAGTLLAALLAWLDARSRGAHLALRIEDVDPTRCTPERAAELREALGWLGLDWDTENLQSEARARHDAALAALAAAGRLYACRCSRASVRAAARRAADGGWRYPGTCREAGLALDGPYALRLRLEPGRVELADEGGEALESDAEAALGDPILRRRDGAIAYHLAAVVDDGAGGITRVVRGRDLAPATVVQVALQRALVLPTPVYRHHFLLLEPAGGKLAKLHGSVSWRTLRECLGADALCGQLAWLAGLRTTPEPTTPRALRADFSWPRVRRDDLAVRWTGECLEPLAAGASGVGTAGAVGGGREP